MEQMQYSVILTRGNSEQVVRRFAGKVEALAFGRTFFESLDPRAGVVSVEGAVKGDPRRRVFKCWYH